MTLWPWTAEHQVQVLRDRLADAEEAVKRLMRYNQIKATTALVMQRELSNAHAALRRKNLTLKRLRAKAKEAQP